VSEVKLKLFVIAILLASIVIGCSGQKEITEKPTVEETEMAEQTEPTEEVQEITTLENDMNEIDDLLNELQDLENINFEI